ncbi:MAG: alpha/beta hydrolase [Saprospiraceae bacterium]|uniref:Alpha/beta hydrolase n=1 Tax=Candidatus Opimibacter skivensis TaxID=2982028 RepID=A0A9D7XRQ1_9BACT|nr:alpha/beta hydrolase [Candidatus Opimibacter skivensis]
MKFKLVLWFFTVMAGLAFTGCTSQDIAEPGNLVPKTVEQDPSLPSISVNNTLLHAETFGNQADPMIVVLHGGPGSDYRSLLNCKAFAGEGYFVVFYDQRGAGLSKREDKSVYSLQLMLDDLTAVIAHYRSSPDQKVFLLGHSWGAMLATTYINTYPDAIDGAILAEPGGFTWADVKDYTGRALETKFFDEQSNDFFYQDQFFTGRENEHDILDYKLALLSAPENAPGNVLGNPGQYPFWRRGAITATALFEIGDRDGFDCTTNLHNYPVKVLFAYSELNRAYGLAHAQKVSSAYPNVQLVEIKGAGHEMIHFGWSNFYPVALTYLNELK